jgi:DNA-directed RNA polymerase specialized sigma24 family protein
LSVEAIADEMIALDRALSRLEGVDEWLARLVEWRFFGGMTEDEIATAEQITSRTVRRDWQKARAFLYRELNSPKR